MTSRLSPSLSQDVPLAEVEIRIGDAFVLVFQVRSGVVVSKTCRHLRCRRWRGRRKGKVIG